MERNQIVFDQIPVTIDIEKNLRLLRINDKKRYSDDFTALAREVEAIAKPKALILSAEFKSLSDNQIEIANIPYTSRVLRVNLDAASRVYPALATCGTEIDEWSAGLNGMLHQFWAISLKKESLNAAVTTMQAKLAELCHPKKASVMTPGSLEDWPIQEQIQLFRLFEKPARELGVRLNDKCCMIPLNTISCLGFSSDRTFYSCQLCPRENCPDRRAAFLENLYQTKYQN